MAHHRMTGRESWRCCSQLLILVVLFIGVIAPYTSLKAQEESGKGKPALPGEPCQIAPHPTWTPQEQWVWDQICVGKVANFNVLTGHGGQLDPNRPDAWRRWKGRILRTVFLETLLLHKPWRDAVPHQGVRIVGAWFREPLDLSDTELPYVFLLQGSRFESIVDLSRLRTPYVLALNGSTVTGKLTMNSLHVGGGLFMRDGAKFTTVDLRGAEIEGQLGLVGAEVTGELTMDSLHVGGSLLMSDGAKFTTVVLRGAEIEGQLSLIGAEVTGELTMNSLHVGGGLFMRDGAKFTTVDLRGAEIESQLSLVGAEVTGELMMDSLHVGGSLLMRDGAKFTTVVLRGAEIEGQLSLVGAEVTGELTMENLHIDGDLFMDGGNLVKVPNIFIIFSTIGNSLDLSGAQLPSLDLTGTTIGGELRLTLDSVTPTWKPGAQLRLRNTKVGALQETYEPNPNTPEAYLSAAWPETLELNGFTYDHLGGLTLGHKSDMAVRPVGWWEAWLNKQKTYGPQPYEQLAKVLREAGRKDTAREILYAGKERERHAACRRTYPGNLQSCELLSPRWLWLSIQKVFIGYGYHLWYALYWTLAAIIAGMIVLNVSGQRVAHDLRYYGFLYSIDMFLPIIPPLRHHYDIRLAGRVVEGYFYIHRFLGLFLASVLIASIPELLLQKG